MNQAYEKNFTSLTSVKSLYFSDWLELIEYSLAIKVSLYAVRNIYKIKNLSTGIS